MPIPWLTVLKTVPWSEVISNAPKVADGARKLWKAVARKPALPADAVEKAVQPGTPTIADLEARISALEVRAADADSQMLASSELIKALAEQNTQLVKRIEGNRVHVLWLTATTIALAIIVLARLIG